MQGIGLLPYCRKKVALHRKAACSYQARRLFLFKQKKSHKFS
tara:strand:+ start:555 stop:680 length:126 start_codon:yes stop_codon:yes gene_type:complete